MCDKASGYNNAAFAFGGIMSPNIAAILADNYGFRTKSDILAIITLSFGIIFFFINVGFKEFFNWHSDPDFDELVLLKNEKTEH